jgi:uncharacterized DUF497 family protein
MKVFNWNDEKNSRLKKERDISFEEIVMLIEDGNILDILVHHNKERYGNQQIFVVKAGDYAYLVPFVENEKEIFLKTIIPSRKATLRYLGGKHGK